MTHSDHANFTCSPNPEDVRRTVNEIYDDWAMNILLKQPTEKLRTIENYVELVIILSYGLVTVIACYLLPDLIPLVALASFSGTGMLIPFLHVCVATRFDIVVQFGDYIRMYHRTNGKVGSVDLWKQNKKGVWVYTGNEE